MEAHKEALEKHFPYYLTQNQQTGLKAAIKDFSLAKKVDYYQSSSEEGLLQGDVWQDFTVLSYYNDKKQKTKGIVLSNSCDVDADNKRTSSPQVVFSPLVTLDKYIERLRTNGTKEEAIQSKLQAIREQTITNMFYLPAHPDGHYNDCVILLDNIHSIPLDVATNNTPIKKVSTLSMFGFYMFVFKISIHFCRLHENINRA
jgi:hypothetical protein